MADTVSEDPPGSYPEHSEPPRGSHVLQLAAGRVRVGGAAQQMCVNPWAQRPEEREGYLATLEDNGRPGR